MRFSQQRAAMGSTAETEAGVGTPRTGHPAHRLFATPRLEVDALCRLVLLRYLQGLDRVLAAIATAHLDGQSPGSSLQGEVDRDAWVRLKSILERIRVVDPACGEGHLLLGMLDLLDNLLRAADQALGVKVDHLIRRSALLQHNLYGVEAQRGTLYRAQQSFGSAVRPRNAVPTPAAPSNLILGDSLVERDEFHWTERFRAVMAVGGFDVVLGNPPYVRHELIADPLGRLPAGEYKRRAFAIAQGRHDAALAGRSPLVLSRRSDLSVLFTVVALTVLRPGGVLGFILPTAIWSAQYGEPLRQVLSSTDFEIGLVEDLSRRSFSNASVNTALLCVRRRVVSAHATAACAVGAHHNSSPCWSPPSSGMPSSQGGTPAGLTRLQGRIEGRCIDLGSMGRLRYPIKTGLNRFFYPDTETRRRFHLEPGFLVPVVKSPRNIQTLTPAREDLSSVLFHCPLSPAELQQAGAHGALAYISWGAQQTRPGNTGDAAVPWPSVPSLRGRVPWYSVPLPADAHILCPRFLYQRFFFVLPQQGILEDQTFYGLELAPEIQQLRLLIGALLNSSLGYLMLETHGRTGLGDGVRQYALRNMATLPVPNVLRVEASAIPEVLLAFQRLACRPITAIEEEVRQADREELDTLVCRAIGLTRADGVAARSYLTTLVRRRLHRARSR